MASSSNSSIEQVDRHVLRKYEIIQKLGMPREHALSPINTAELAKALAREMGGQSLG